MLSTTSNINQSSGLRLTHTLIMFYVIMHIYMLCFVDTAQLFHCIFQYQVAEGRYPHTHLERTDRAVARQRETTGHAAVLALLLSCVGTSIDYTMSDRDIILNYDNDGGNYTSVFGLLSGLTAACLYSVVYGPLVAEQRPVSCPVRGTPSLVLSISRIVYNPATMIILRPLTIAISIVRMAEQCCQHNFLISTGSTACTQMSVPINTRVCIILAVSVLWHNDYAKMVSVDRPVYNFVDVKLAIFIMGTIRIRNLYRCVDYCRVFEILTSPVCSNVCIMSFFFAYSNICADRRKSIYMADQQIYEPSFYGKSHLVAMSKSAIYQPSESHTIPACRIERGISHEVTLILELFARYLWSPVYSQVCIPEMIVCGSPSCSFYTIYGFSLMVTRNASQITVHPWQYAYSHLSNMYMNMNRILIVIYIIFKRYVKHSHIISKVYHMYNTNYIMASDVYVNDAIRFSISKNPWE